MSRILLHIGYAKAGSTFLQKWYKMHPQLLYKPFGIGGFESVFEIIDLAVKHPDKIPKYYVTSREAFSAGWVESRGGALRILSRDMYGYSHNIHKYQVQICNILHHLFPNGRVLIVTRGFEGIIRSSYSEFIKFGGYLSIAEFWDLLETNFIQWLDFTHLITIYKETFGEKNLILVPYELLRDDQQAFIEYLENALGLDHHEINPGNPNPSLSTEEAYWYAKFSRHFVAPWTNRLSDQIATRIYYEYSRRIVRPNMLSHLVKILNSIFEMEKSWDDLPADYLSNFLGKAEILEKYPMYEKYMDAYLIT